MILNIFRPAGWEARYNVKVPMRDGVRLSCDIYSPRGKSGPFPVLLVRTPYDNMHEMFVEAGEFFVQHGYVYVIQDVRGRNDSDGEFYPWVNEFNDGHDTIEWIGAQPWCDGNVGMHGISYLANVQWYAAMLGSSYLKCIVPQAIGDNLHDSPFYQGGAFSLGLNVTWAFWAGEGRVWQNIDRYNWPQLFHALPLKDMAKMAGKDVKFLQDWIDHPDYDDYWKALSVKERYEDVKVPVLQMTGWYDIFPAGVLNNFLGMREKGGSELARNNQKVVVGPWTHFLSTLTNAGDGDFGRDSIIDLREIELKWYDHWLKGVDNGIEREPPLRILVMGTNEWRDEHEWPLARTSFTPYYFHSGGAANSYTGDGVLSTQAPGDEPPDRYDYDPAFPTPTLGGSPCCRNGHNPTRRVRPARGRGQEQHPCLHFGACAGGPGGHRAHHRQAPRQHRSLGHGLHRQADRRPSRRILAKPLRRHHPGPLPRVHRVPEAARARHRLRVHYRPMGHQQPVPEGPQDSCGHRQQQLPPLRPQPQHGP